MTAALRWEPDEVTVDAIIASPRSSRDLTDMDTLDRCWLVAALGLAGMKAEEIAHRTGCCLRLVRTIRAEPATKMAEVALAKTNQAFNLLYAEKSGHSLTRQELTEAQAAAAKIRLQFDQLVDAHVTGRVEIFRCGCPKVKYNVYEHAGKQYCRACRRDRQAKRRAAVIVTSAVITC